MINLVNTFITNFLSRRQEISVLQAVGLSHKQLLQMLRYEGIIYVVVTTFFTVSIGTGLGILCVIIIKSANPYYFNEFPWPVVLGYLLFLILVQIKLTVFIE